MLLIPCPCCGLRDETEFHYGGQSHLARPEPYDEVSDDQWSTYLFYRQNPKGWRRERWHHQFGCRRWFNVIRSTIDHSVAASYLMDQYPDLEDVVAERPGA